MRKGLIAAVAVLAACGPQPPAAAQNGQAAVTGERPFAAAPFTYAPVANYNEPWAMAFLPDGRFLVTEKSGTLRVGTQTGQKSGPIAGVPKVDYGGQGGLGDVVLHPDFANNRTIYLSYAEAGPNSTRGAAVLMAKLALQSGVGGGRLETPQVIWRQEPKVTGRGHFSHRIAFSPDGQFLFISSGDRQKFTPAQDLNQNLGKVIRLTPTGGIPSDNPFYNQGRVKAQVWSYGHRNLLGLAFDGQGRLWDLEHGPAGGDELNLVLKGRNYGWPVVSNGNHYDGRPIPRHPSQPRFEAPKVSWNPVIAPGNFIFYSGRLFPDWRGDVLIPALKATALVRVEVNGGAAREAERYEFDTRLRQINQGPDGALWALEDGPDARLLKLTPKGAAAASAGR